MKQLVPTFLQKGFRLFLLALVFIYQRLLSPLLGPGKCRFDPTCSAYAVHAIKNGPLGEALVKIGRRLLRCHPWYHGPS